MGKLLCCACLLVAASIASAQPTQRYFDDIGRIYCVEGAERYLPGDYYFCVANKALQQGKARKARAMFEESANWGDKRAMFNLGLLLVRGEGMPKDEPLGLAWLALSAERSKDQLQRETLVSAWSAATPETRDAANALWNSMKLKYADRVVLPRAQQRYERETSRLRVALQFDPFMKIELAGVGHPWGGTKAMQLLDEAANETILWPLPNQKGEVIIGNPETVREPAKDAGD